MVFPSLCYETFGLVAVEAMATGLPVVGSQHGAIAEVVRDGETGLLFKPGNAADLRAKVITLLDRPDVVTSMRKQARAEYLRRYTADDNFHALLGIYEDAVRKTSRSRQQKAHG